MAGLNVSPTFAAAAADVPVLGGLFQVLTIRDYETVENGIDYKVTVPGVESEGDLAEKVNAEIQERVDAHLAQAQADWDDYKDAFLATGGTEEEWADREMNVLIDYEIKSQTDTTVSFVVDFAEGLGRCHAAAVLLQPGPGQRQRHHPGRRAGRGLGRHLQ